MLLKLSPLDKIGVGRRREKGRSLVDSEDGWTTAGPLQRTVAFPPFHTRRFSTCHPYSVCSCLYTKEHSFLPLS